MGNELQEGDAVLCIDHYPCEFVSQEVKDYVFDSEKPAEPNMMYTVKFTSNSLYPKGTTRDVLESELQVVITVQKYFVPNANSL
jgi:hypothetical protein